MSKFDFNIPHKPAHRPTASSRRAAAVIPVFVTATAAVIAATAFLLTGGCGSGGGKTVSPLSSAGSTTASPSGTTAVTTGRVTVSLQWPGLTTATAASRRISSAARRVELFVTNGLTDPRTNTGSILFQQVLSRTQDSGSTQTVVFPAVPFRKGLYLQAIAKDENGLEIATASSSIFADAVVQAGAPPSSTAIPLALGTTATTITVDNDRTPVDYEEFTQTLPPAPVPVDKHNVKIPVGASRTFMVSATDVNRQGVFLAPDDLNIDLPAGFSSVPSGGGRYRITATPPSDNTLPQGLIRFEVKDKTGNLKDKDGNLTGPNFDVTVAGTANIGVSALNIKDALNTPLDKVGKAFVRAQNQALTFNFPTYPSTDVSVQVRYLKVKTANDLNPDFDLNKDDPFIDYPAKPFVNAPEGVVTLARNGTAYQGTFSIGAKVAVKDSVTGSVDSIDTGNADQPVLYQIILTSSDGTGRAIIPVLVNSGIDLGVTGPKIIYKNTPGTTYTASAPDAVNFSLTGPTPTAFTLTNITPQTAALTRVGVPKSGTYMVTATRSSTGAVSTTTFVVPDITVSITDATGRPVAPVTDATGAAIVPTPTYLLSGVRQTFNAFVSGLDPNVAGKGVTWKEGVRSLPSKTNLSVDYQFPILSTGYDPSAIYTITATSNDDTTSSTLFPIKIDPRYLKVTIQ